MHQGSHAVCWFSRGGVCRSTYPTASPTQQRLRLSGPSAWPLSGPHKPLGHESFRTKLFTKNNYCTYSNIWGSAIYHRIYSKAVRIVLRNQGSFLSLAQMSKQSSAFQNMWVYLINAVITRKPKGIDLVHTFLRNLHKFSIIGLLGQNTLALIYQKNIHQNSRRTFISTHRLAFIHLKVSIRYNQMQI